MASRRKVIFFIIFFDYFLCFILRDNTTSYHGFIVFIMSCRRQKLCPVEGYFYVKSYKNVMTCRLCFVMTCRAKVL